MDVSAARDPRRESVTDSAHPGIAIHDGRAVTWEEWEESPPLTHIKNECARCKFTGLPLVTTGLVHPLPDETFTVPDDVAQGRSKQVPAWPLRRLIAFRCPACGNQDVYDRGRDGTSFDRIDHGEQPTLF